MSYVNIGGEVLDVEVCRYDPHLISCGTREWYVFSDAEEAGEAAREYWGDMAETDPEELAWFVGRETLVSWGLGQLAGPGTTQVSSLEAWLDLWLDLPEEHWAGYDGYEVDGTLSKEAAEEIGIDSKSAVFYRHN